MKSNIIIKYNEVFDDSPHPVVTYLQGISKQKIITACLLFLKSDNPNSKFRNYQSLVYNFFCSENKLFADFILKKLNQLQERDVAPIIIINHITSLRLFEIAFDNLTDDESLDSANIEINIFKAILLINQQITEEQKKAAISTAHFTGKKKASAMSLAMTFPYSELFNTDRHELLTSQVIKSIHFFEYLEKNEKCRPLLEEFQSHLGCNTWKTFLKNLLPICFLCIEMGHDQSFKISITEHEKYRESCEFIERLIIKETESLSDYDFKKLRSKPLFKISEGVYQVVFAQFLIELIHKGVYFKLNEINKTLTKPQQIKEFRSFYCDEFSEKTLLYNVIHSIYGKRYVKYSGEELKAIGIEAEPDYYIRNGNKLFLFESKDFLIEVTKKISYDFNIYEEEFKKKLYFDSQSDKKKAICQLMLNIERALLKSNAFDTNYKEKNLQIYPIIICHDHQYNVSGLNFLLDEWFEDELNKIRIKGIKVDKVRAVTLINIDTLIFHQELFRDRKITLDGIIDKYIQSREYNLEKGFRSRSQLFKKVGDMFSSFAHYMTTYAFENKIRRVPEMLITKGTTLFD